MNGWRLFELSREAARSLYGSRLRSLSLVFGIASVVGLLTFTELRATSNVIAFQRSVEAKGGWIGIIANPDGTLPARECDALAQASWVMEAGGLKRSDSIELTKAPGTLFQTAIATSGAVRIWSSDPPSYGDLSTGVAVGLETANEVGLQSGMQVTEMGSSGTLRVGAVVSVEERYPAASRWIVKITAPIDRIDECWVEFKPGLLEAGLGAASLSFPEATRIEARRLIRLDGFARGPRSELANRPQVHAWLPAGVLIAAVMWLVVWFRRADIGLYRAIGTNGPSLLVLVQLESLMVCVPALVSGYLWAALLFAIQQDGFPGWDEFGIALRSVMSATLVAIVLAPIVVLAVGRDQIANQLKDR